jgi:hypothetical protein
MRNLPALVIQLIRPDMDNFILNSRSKLRFWLLLSSVQLGIRNCFCKKISAQKLFTCYSLQYDKYSDLHDLFNVITVIIKVNT